MKPFQGLTFCPTGIADEAVSRALLRRIVKLGGVYSKDLTKQVNVLVSGPQGIVDTPKYAFAVRYRHDIVFVCTSAIDELYELWLAGEDITFASHSTYKSIRATRDRMLAVLQSRYTAPALRDFYLFIGRITDPDHPIAELTALCRSQGCYKCNPNHFVKEVKTLHNNLEVLFITDHNQGARVDAARAKNVPIVHFKWVLDCHRRGARIPYDPHYLLDNVAGQRLAEIGQGACECLPLVLQLRKPDSGSSNETGIGHLEDADDIQASKPVVSKKFLPTGHKLWENTMSKEGQSLKTGSSSNLLAKVRESTNSERQDPGLFHQKYFSIDICFPERHRSILEKVIQDNDGVIASEQHADYHIIPYSKPLSQILSDNPKVKLVTEFFVERCLHYKKLIDPLDSWCKPFLQTSDFEILPSKKLSNGFQNGLGLRVSITGFQGVELLHLIKILELLKPMGIEYAEYLNNSTDLLLVNLSALPSIPSTHKLWNNSYSDLFKEALEGSTNTNPVFRNSLKRKIEYVKTQHSIPAVTPAFLWEIFSCSAKNPEYTIHINNINWCIICPKGTKTDFECRVTNKLNSTRKVLGTVSAYANDLGLDQQPSTKLSSHEISEKSTSKKIPVPVNEALNKELILKRENSDHVVHKDNIKRQKSVSGLKPAPQYKRTSSMGAIISEEFEKHLEQSVLFHPDANNEIVDSSDRINSAISETCHTQVTYGSPKATGAKSRDSVPPKRLTRSHLKEIDM